MLHLFTKIPLVLLAVSLSIIAADKVVKHEERVVEHKVVVEQKAHHETVGEKASRIAGNVVVTTKKVAHKTKDAVCHAAAKTKDAVVNVGNKIRKVAHRGQEKVAHGVTEVKHKARKAVVEMKYSAEKAQDKNNELAHRVKEAVAEQDTEEKRV